MIYTHKLPRIILTSLLAVLMLFFLISCGSREPESIQLPTASPSARSGSAPSPPTSASESGVGGGLEGIILPSPTPAPTATPDLVTELVEGFVATTGLEEVTVFRAGVDDWLNLGFSIILAFVFGFLISRLLHYLLTKLAARTKTEYDDLFVARIRSQISMIMIVLGVQTGTVRLAFLDALTKLMLGRLYTALYVLASIIILWKLADVLVEWYQKEVEPQREDPHQVDTILLLLHRIARAFLVMIGLITLLSLYNINVNALIAALGVGGLAVSLAAQDTLSNVMSGIMIMMDQPFRVGDRIEIQKIGTWGDVVDIGLRSTRIRTIDNRMVIIPNNILSTDQVINYSYPDPQYRIQIELGIGYSQDIEKVRQLLIDTVKQVPGVIPYRSVDALIVNMGDYAIIFRVRWWIESYVDTRRMYDRVYTNLLNALDEAGIEIPYDTYHIDIMKMPDTQKGNMEEKS